MLSVTFGSAYLRYEDPKLKQTAAIRGLKRGIEDQVDRLLHVGNAIGGPAPALAARTRRPSP